jgi:hypothetical protein
LLRTVSVCSDEAPPVTITAASLTPWIVAAPAGSPAQYGSQSAVQPPSKVTLPESVTVSSYVPGARYTMLLPAADAAVNAAAIVPQGAPCEPHDAVAPPGAAKTPAAGSGSAMQDEPSHDFVNPGSHANPHALPEQTLAACPTDTTHGRAQAPQLLVLVVVSTHDPPQSVGAALEQPVTQVAPLLPALQTGALGGHAMPHAPQLSERVRSASQPLSGSPSQLPQPGAQDDTGNEHAPAPEQDTEPLT